MNPNPPARPNTWQPLFLFYSLLSVSWANFKQIMKAELLL